MARKHDSETISSSGSTPRVLTIADPRDLQHPDATKDPTRTNEFLNKTDGTCTPPHRISESTLEDPPLPHVIHNINVTDDSYPIRHVRKILAHQIPTVGGNLYNCSRSVPTIPLSRSQVQSKENGRRHSEPNHVYWKLSSLRSEPPTISEQLVQQSTWLHDLSFSEPHENLSTDAILMKDFSTLANLPKMEENFVSPPMHVQETSSAIEFPMLYDQWQRISQTRSHISSLRETLRVMRLKLRMLRDEKSLADDAYFKEVKMREFQMPFPDSWWPQKTLSELLCDSQKARDEYGPLEDEYNNLENDLSSQEYQLSRQEENFYSQLRDPSRFFPTSIEPGKAISPPEWQETHVSHEPHPLVEAYLSKLGELDIFRERYDDILDEKLNLEEQLALRKRFDMSLLPENQQWLDSSQSQLDDLTSKIQVAEKEERELRRKCFSLGLIAENGEPIEPSQSHQSGSMLNNHSEKFENSREYVQIPSLLPPEPNSLETNLKVLDSDHNYIARNERFDQWSLEKLQLSLFEIDVYANCFNTSDQVRDLIKIKEEVFKDNFVTIWFTDGFTNNAPKSTGLTSCHSTSQYILNTISSYSKCSPSNFVFSKGSSHSGSDNSDSAEGGIVACVLPLSDIFSTIAAV